VSGEKCRYPPPGHGRYLRVPTKKSAKHKHMLKPAVPSFTVKNHPMA